MRTLMFTLMTLVASVAFSATVYKWVDDDGITHYSDQPHEKAQKIEVQAPQTYTAPKLTEKPRNTAGPQKAAPTYQSCAISAPTDDQMFMNTDTVTAGVVVTPLVRPGDVVVVTLDGQRVPGVPPEGGGFTISPVDRGTHSLQAVVHDSQGKAVCQSKAITFHVHQPSLQNPVRPARH